MRYLRLRFAGMHRAARVEQPHIVCGWHIEEWKDSQLAWVRLKKKSSAHVLEQMNTVAAEWTALISGLEWLKSSYRGSGYELTIEGSGHAVIKQLVTQTGTCVLPFVSQLGNRAFVLLRELSEMRSMASWSVKKISWMKNATARRLSEKWYLIKQLNTKQRKCHEYGTTDNLGVGRDRYSHSVVADARRSEVAASIHGIHDS